MYTKSYSEAAKWLVKQKIWKGRSLIFELNLISEFKKLSVP
jgi:hypothetical protein